MTTTTPTIVIEPAGNTAEGVAHDFVGYEYLDLSVPASLEGVTVDTYTNLGWRLDAAHRGPLGTGDKVTLKFKRDRMIRNKAELSRLQRQADADLHQIDRLRSAPGSFASILAFTLGLLGCAFMAGAVFSYLANMIVAMIVLAVPGFVLWIAVYPVWRRVRASREMKIAPRLDALYDSLYDTARRGNALVNG